MFNNNNKGFYAFLISGFYLKEYIKMQKHDKEFFINWFEAHLENDKNEFRVWVDSFKTTNNLDDLHKVVNYANSICFNADLLDVLKE